MVSVCTLLLRSNWLLKARQKTLDTAEFRRSLLRRRRRRRRHRWLRRRGGRVMFLLLILLISNLLVLRIVIAESLSMKRKSGPTPYTINPEP